MNMHQEADKMTFLSWNQRTKPSASDGAAMKEDLLRREGGSAGVSGGVKRLAPSDDLETGTTM